MHPAFMVTYYTEQSSLLDTWIKMHIVLVNVNMPLVVFEATAVSTDVTQWTHMHFYVSGLTLLGCATTVMVI